MRNDILAKSSPTAQVRLLTLNLLSDGKVHSRKEIVAYLKQKSVEYNLKYFSQGCIAGGIQQAVTANGCEKVDSAKYQFKGRITDVDYITIFNSTDDYTESYSETLSQKAIKTCNNFSGQLVSISRGIDYVSADDKELEMLNLLRECIRTINEWKKSFEKCD